jgi:hypothetical protein
VEQSRRLLRWRQRPRGRGHVRFAPGAASLPATASDAVAFLDQAYGRWHDGIAGLDEAALRTPLGPKGGEFEDPMAGLVVHISREVMHHGGEICLLRDLYQAGGPVRG